MARTTLNIDSLILEEVKRVQIEQGGSLGAVVSRLLAEALSSHFRTGQDGARVLRWHSKAMKARVDLEDKDAVYRLLEEENGL